MPLTAKPGVFRGQVMNHWTWFVVDPAADDPEDVRQRWESDYAGTNSPRGRRGIARIVPWAVFVVVSLIWILVAVAIESSVGTTNRAIGIVVVAIAGITVSTILGFVTANALYPTTIFPEVPHPEVVGVPSAVEEWAAKDMPIDDLWNLAVQYNRVEQLVDFAEEYPYVHPTLPWFAPQYEAFFADLEKTEFAALEQAAARLHFQIPAKLKPRSAR